MLIVDDHAVFTDAMAQALDGEDDIEIVATAASGAAALAVGDEVDVVLCDFRLPDLDGVEVTRRLLARDPSTSVVMLTASTDDSILAAAVEAGCVGFLSKSSALDDVLAAVRAAAVGESVISPALLARLLPRMAGRASGVDDLTPREHEVLAEMAKGLSNQAIGEALYVSRDTIRNHVANILRKLDAHSKLEAVATAARRGLIAFEPER